MWSLEQNSIEASTRVPQIECPCQFGCSGFAVNQIGSVAVYRVSNYEVGQSVAIKIACTRDRPAHGSRETAGKGGIDLQIDRAKRFVLAIDQVRTSGTATQEINRRPNQEIIDSISIDITGIGYRIAKLFFRTRAKKRIALDRRSNIPHINRSCQLTRAGVTKDYVRRAREVSVTNDDIADPVVIHIASA